MESPMKHVSLVSIISLFLAISFIVASVQARVAPCDESIVIRSYGRPSSEKPPTPARNPPISPGVGPSHLLDELIVIRSYGRPSSEKPPTPRRNPPITPGVGPSHLLGDVVHKEFTVIQSYTAPSPPHHNPPISPTPDATLPLSDLLKLPIQLLHQLYI